jgi:hypothetical protein
LTPVLKYGPVAERLGRGLQNLLHQFKSGRDLRIKDRLIAVLFSFYTTLQLPPSFSVFYNNGHQQRLITDHVEKLGDLGEILFFAAIKRTRNIGKGQGKRITRLFFTRRDT